MNGASTHCSVFFEMSRVPKTATTRGPDELERAPAATRIHTADFDDARRFAGSPRHGPLIDHDLGNPLPAQLRDGAEQEARRDLPQRRRKSAEPYAAANDLRLRHGFLAQYDEPAEALGQLPRSPLRE